LQVQEKRKKAMAPLNHSWEECEEEEYEDDDDDDGTDCSDWTDNSSMDSDHPSSVKHAQEITRRHVHEKRTPFYKYQICLYIQMQLCHSSTLADWIRQRNHSMIRSSTDSSDLIDYHHHARPAFEIFRQILKGLVHVHSRGIIHRDLKPANIFAAEDGVFKIGDFGLSKLLHIFEDPIPCTEDTTRVLLLPPNNTEADISAVSAERGMIVNDLHTAGVGTASYAAPEQMKSSSYGPEADVYRYDIYLD
jgi:serine/threonine protein kinase